MTACTKIPLGATFTLEKPDVSMPEAKVKNGGHDCESKQESNKKKSNDKEFRPNLSLPALWKSGHCVVPLRGRVDVT